MHYNFLRKAACDFGWDWGPGFGQCGISGDLQFHTYNYPHVIGMLMEKLSAL